MIASLSRLVPALLRHLDAYRDIAEEDAKDAASSLGACLLAALSAASLAIVSVLMLCAWLMVLTWDEPWRVWVPAVLAAFFALVAIGCVVAYRRRRPGKSTFFWRVRREWRRDRVLIERALSGPHDDEAWHHPADHRREAA